MRNTLRKNNLSERARVRIVVALGLVVTLAGFGCTTNRTHAEGEPYLGAPSVGPSSPTSTNGSSVPTTPQPMTSSYRGNEQALATPRPHRLTPDEAALIMADHLPRVRVLGPVDPGKSTRSYASDGMVTGQVQNAAAYLNPQVTINSSITSPGVAAITNGAGGDAASSGGAIFTQASTLATPTTAGLTTPITSASSTSAPTTTLGIMTPITAASATTPATTTAATTTNTTSSLNTTAVAANGNVRVATGNGKIVVTNVNPR
jgi:hypothetical protein